MSDGRAARTPGSGRGACRAGVYPRGDRGGTLHGSCGTGANKWNLPRPPSPGRPSLTGPVPGGPVSASTVPGEAPSGRALPALSRRHEAGAGSARGLLFTLLGEFVLPGEGAAWTSAVLAAFERMGVAEKATRQALMRTSNAGWLSAEKVGRRTRWLLTPAATGLLTEGARRIYSFGPAREWDGQWVLVQVRIPETDRRARHVVRTRLAWAGFGSLGPGLWISPHVAREQEATRVLAEAGVAGDAHVFVARRTGLSDTRDDGRRGLGPAGDRGGVRAVRRGVPRARACPRTCCCASLSWCTPGGGSPRSTRPCRASCCRPAGPGPGRRSCSTTGTSGGWATRAASGSG